VRVHDDADVLIEGVAQDDVGGFAADATKIGEFFHRCGNFAGVFFDNVGGGFAEGFGFVSEKAGGLDDGLDVLLRGLGQGGGGGIFFEEDRSNHIDTHISALGRKNGGHQQFKGVFVMQGAVGVRVEALEQGDDLRGALLFGGK